VFLSLAVVPLCAESRNLIQKSSDEADHRYALQGKVARQGLIMIVQSTLVPVA